MPGPGASSVRRRLPIGAELVATGSVHLRVWAPHVSRVDAVLTTGESTPLTAEAGGYFSATIAASAGDRYQFRLGGDQRLYPHPASRFQADGPHRASQIVHPSAVRRADRG